MMDPSKMHAMQLGMAQPSMMQQPPQHQIRQAPQQSSACKKPTNAYGYFVKMCYEEHKKKYPNEHVQVTEISKKCSEKWKTMTDNEKRRFYELAQKDAERYQAECAMFGEDYRKRKRQKKDPAAPKRALSAFFFFSQEKRPDIQQQHPDWRVGTIAQELGRMWKLFSPEEKQIYEDRASNDRDRYENEMKEYKAGRLVPSRQPKPPAQPAAAVQQQQQQQMMAQQMVAPGGMMQGGMQPANMMGLNQQSPSMGFAPQQQQMQMQQPNGPSDVLQQQLLQQAMAQQQQQQQQQQVQQNQLQQQQAQMQQQPAQAMHAGAPTSVAADLSQGGIPLAATTAGQHMLPQQLMAPAVTSGADMMQQPQMLDQQSTMMQQQQRWPMDGTAEMRQQPQHLGVASTSAQPVNGEQGQAGASPTAEVHAAQPAPVAPSADFATPGSNDDAAQDGGNIAAPENAEAVTGEAVDSSDTTTDPQSASAPTEQGSLEGTNASE